MWSTSTWPGLFSSTLGSSEGEVGSSLPAEPFLSTDYPASWKAPAGVSGKNLPAVSGDYGFLLTLVQPLEPEKGALVS